MRVLLVRPLDITDEIIPPISLGWLAAQIRGQHSVKILDALKARMDHKAIGAVVKNGDFDVVGFQVWSKDIHNVKNISNAIKAVKPDTKIIVGGSHPTVLPVGTMKFFGDSIDYAYQGEGEIGFRRLLEVLSSDYRSGDLGRVPGLVWKDGSDIKANGNTFIEDLDNIGFPAWDLMPPSTYPKAPHGAFFRNFPVAPIIVTRGCPFPCSFCSANVISGRKIRSRSVDHVLEELMILHHKFGVREFHIEDDNFTANSRFVEEFCEALLSKSLKMTWGFPNGIRLDTVNRSLLKLMKRAGCYALNFGIESGSSRILKMIRKKINLEQIREQLSLAHEEGFDTGGFFILGFPTESREEIEETIRFACSLPLDRVGVSYFQPFPGSRLFHELVNAGEIRQDWADHHYTTLHNLTYISRSISIDELRRLRRKMLLSFYLRPKTLKDLLKQINSPAHLYHIGKRGIRWLKA